MHCTALGTEFQEVVIRDAYSEHLLDNIESNFSSIVKELMYPAYKNGVPFTIPLIDSAVKPEKHLLYPLSEVELAELWIELSSFLDASHVVPSSSPYRHPM